MPLVFTPLMKKRLTRRAQTMIERSLPYFPELQGEIITVGLTRKHLGSATIGYRAGAISRLIIRLKVRNVTYQTIGHELTHLVQGLARGNRWIPSAAVQHAIPSGEKQCDIWTLARDVLFCDDPPTYLRIPRAVRERWPDYAESVRELCIAAIARRTTQRRYIQWLEVEIKKVSAKKSLPEQGPRQLSLPFTF